MRRSKKAKAEITEPAAAPRVRKGKKGPRPPEHDAARIVVTDGTAPKQEPAREKPTHHAVELGEFEQLLVQGDLSVLSEEQRIRYYKDVCRFMGLNPLTRPFQYITFWEEKEVKNQQTGKVEKKWVGQMQLYATKSCSEQLASTRKISTQVMSYREGADDLYYVQSRASGPDGRFADRLGVVDLKGLTGKRRANAIMKCETKASRRAVLGYSGLSMMDETEAEDMPSSQRFESGEDAVRALERRHAAPPAITDETGNQPTVAQVIVEPKKEPVAAVPGSGSPDGRPEPPPVGDPVGQPAQASGKYGKPSPELQRELDRQEREREPEQKQGISAGDDAPRLDMSLYPGAGVSYPAPPADVIAKHEAERYMPLLLWLEKFDFDKHPGAAAALKKDFALSLKGAKRYGGPHWARMIAVFDKSDAPIAQEHR